MALSQYQRVQNLLISTARSGIFRPVVFDPDTGLASTDTSTNVAPSTLQADEIESQYDDAQLSRMAFVRERNVWRWELRLEFPSRISSEEFEKSLAEAPPTLKADSASGLRQARIILSSATYVHPPHQQPRMGSKISITVEVIESPT